jgi:hypothetical protein
VLSTAVSMGASLVPTARITSALPTTTLASGVPKVPITPAPSRSTSGNTPLPAAVVATGASRARARANRASPAWPTRTPLPAMITGRVAERRAPAATSSTPVSTAGDRRQVGAGGADSPT